MSAPTTSHAALIAEVTALRTSLGDAVEMVEALRSERDALVKTAAEFAGDTVIMTVQRDALRAERDKLSHALNLHIELAATLRSERDKLRAALERFAP